MTYDEWTYVLPSIFHPGVLSRNHELWLNNRGNKRRNFKFSSPYCVLTPHTEVRGITGWLVLERGLLEGWLSG